VPEGEPERLEALRRYQALKPDEVALAERVSKVSALTEVAAQFLQRWENK
jgi:hypothetical protein